MDSALTVGWCGSLQSDLFPSWIEAIGAFGGAVVAFIALVYLKRTWQDTKGQLATAKSQLRLEYDRDSEQQKLAERSQADQIAAWIDKGISIDKDRRDIHVANLSTQPVYRLTVRLRANGEILPEPGPGLARMDRTMLGPLPVDLPVPLYTSLDPTERIRLDEAEREGQPSVVCFSFTDVHGEDWTRLWDGRLVPGRDRFIPTADNEPLRATMVYATGWPPRIVE